VKHIFLFSIFVFFSIEILFSQSDSLCQEINLQSSDFVNKFQTLNDSTFLDSALYYTDLGILNCSNNDNLIGRKLFILSLKHEYDQGIQLIKTLRDPFFISFPYYNDVLLKRFYAMKSLYNRDSISYLRYINSIITDIEPYFIKNQEFFDRLCKNKLDVILNNELYFLFFQYYYYISLIWDADTFSNELMIMLNKGYNSECIDLLKMICSDNFLEYNVF
jgi:hypothetical protein